MNKTLNERPRRNANKIGVRKKYRQTPAKYESKISPVNNIVFINKYYFAGDFCRLQCSLVKLANKAQKGEGALRGEG